MSNKKTSIWISPPLEKLKTKLENVSFSRRLADIVERYDAIMSNTPAPELSPIEMAIFSEIISGSELTPLTVKYMHELVMDCATGTPAEKMAFEKRLKEMTAAEKIAIIESVDWAW